MNKGIFARFRREPKLMLWFVIVVTLLLLAAAFIFPRIKGFVAVDRCLDSGGSFNQESHQCEVNSQQGG